MASTGDTWRLGHRPALDGVRGIAVLLVVVSHLVDGGPVHNLGAVGVVMFFTLSGFLITTLLLEERSATGGVRMGAFYARRARRLLPAMLVCLAVVVAVGLFVPGYASLRLVVGALTYTSNLLMVDGSGTGALTHFWSLAVEEQFYLAAPVALLVLPPRALRLVLAVSVGALAVWPFLLAPASWERLYFGTDVRMLPLLVGCLLAAVMHGRVERPPVPALAGIALAGAAASAWVPSFVFLLLVTPTLVAVLTAGAIYASAQGPGVRWLEAPWLTLVGRRSYGLYLWHWPVILLADRLLGEPSTWVLAVAAVPVAWLLTLASWRFVETPAMRVARSRRSRRRAAAAVVS